jgi:hypothetical protein
LGDGMSALFIFANLNGQISASCEARSFEVRSLAALEGEPAA